MAFREPLDRRIACVARQLAGLSSAEAWRRLRPVAARLGVRWPSYQTVRRLLVLEREIRRLRRARRIATAKLWADLEAGRVPWAWLHDRIQVFEPG